MVERGINRHQLQSVIQSPAEQIGVRFGRTASYGIVGVRRLVVVYEQRNGEIEVITTFWADIRRLEKLGFAGVRP